MAPKRKATLKSKWWKDYFGSIKYCHNCSGPLKKSYVLEEKTRRLVCQECRTITYLNPKIVVGLIPVTSSGDIVLLRRSIEPAINKWTYPAGFQELGETCLEGAVRETKEEILAEVTVKNFLGLFSYKDAGVVTIVYEGLLKRGQIPRPGLESREVKIFKVNSIPWKELAFRSTTEALKKWKKGQRKLK